MNIKVIQRLQTSKTFHPKHTSDRHSYTTNETFQSVSSFSKLSSTLQMSLTYSVTQHAAAPSIFRSKHHSLMPLLDEPHWSSQWVV